MARAVIYDDDGNILQLTEASDENIFATAFVRGDNALPIPGDTLSEDFYLDSTHKVVAGFIVEL